MTELTYRQDVRAGDAARVREIVESTRFFYDYEVDVAVELVEERLNRGEESGYHFLFAEQDGRTVGYSCYGPIACTSGSFDLYWIAVHDDFRNRGIGKKLLQKSEEQIAGMQGRAVWVETSSQPKYEPTRQFYLRSGYTVEAVLKDFYAENDDKVVFIKRFR
jgi:ribosomal protein S18 acetylase RimI-like enzyme